MKAATLTTTLIELNRLYSVYVEALDKRTLRSQEAESAWVGYETYVKRYKEERGMEDLPLRKNVMPQIGKAS